ncbi:MAG: FeoB-associated Cys-rich membrane protein [Candidatus Faecousia sp.]|nr:FeoB-associated Cys-rich membrane protein [Candidatus Faecousia sp.]
MSVIDWLLLALIVGYCLYLLLRKKEPRSCSGDCPQCPGCHDRKHP